LLLALGFLLGEFRAGQLKLVLKAVLKNLG
jgi:hypothetical protein